MCVALRLFLVAQVRVSCPLRAMARRVAREEYDHLCWMIKKWNENRLELFEITLPNEVNTCVSVPNTRVYTRTCEYTISMYTSVVGFLAWGVSYYFIIAGQCAVRV